MVSVETLVFAKSLLRLKGDLPYLYLMPMLASKSLRVSDSIAENMTLNRVGASTQPCFTLLETGNGAEVSPLSCSLASMPSWNWRIMAKNFVGQLYFAIILHRPSLLTVSKALVRLTKVEYRSLFCSWHFSWSCLAVSTMLIAQR